MLCRAPHGARLLLYNKYMDYLRKNRKEFIVGTLFIFNLLIWLRVYSIQPRDYVSVSFFDVGQGDGALIESTNRNRILIDGGKDKFVLREISKALPFFDRHIDVVIESHPDKDHIGGLPEVVSRLSVGAFMEPGVESENSVDDELRKRVLGKNIPIFLARAGQIIDMGDGSYFKILFPDRDVSGVDTNDASIVLQYIYGDTCFLFTGDSPVKIEEYLIGVYKEELNCEVLKVGHHGSRTSTSEEYLYFVKPKFAVISAGKENSYGHPHQEVLDNLNKFKVKILSTIEDGTIKFISNGLEIRKK